MSRVAIIGGSGLLGHCLVQRSLQEGDMVLSTYESHPLAQEGAKVSHLDIRDVKEVSKVLHDFAPDLVLVPAAMTNVDSCERSPTVAWEINAEGPMNVAQMSREIGAKMLYVSTDYVFNGMKGSKYYEFENPDPISIYGQTKFEGERSVMDAGKGNLVCRVSVLYGWNQGGKDNFVTWAIKELRQGRPLKLFEDQFVSPTYAPHCAEVLLRLIRTDAKGIYHTSGPDCVSRLEMGRAIAAEFKLDTKLVQASRTKEANLVARRPDRSCLSVDKVESTLGTSMLSFTNGLADMKRTEVP